MKTESGKKICICCANTYASSSFYSHRNRLINEQFGFCKKCAKAEIDVNKMDTLDDFLRTMDIPYLKSFWKQANDDSKETIGIYLKNLNSLNQNKYLRYKDSNDIAGKTSKAELADIKLDEFELTEAIVKKWGRNLEIEDYMFLEEEFQAIGGLEAETTIQERLFKNMARTQWMANSALEEGDTNKYEKMMKTLSALMQDANIKPVQIKSASQDGRISSYGEFIRMIEETEPIEDGEKNYEPKFIKDYVNKYFITQIKRLFNRASEEEIAELNRDGDDSNDKR